MKLVRFLLHAELEMLDAGRYYESQAVNLGTDFISKVESAVKDVSLNPER